MREMPNQKQEETPPAGPETVVQALDSDDSEVRASALNATLGLLFRLNGLTQERQMREQQNREATLTRLPIDEALQSEDGWIQSRAAGEMQRLAVTLEAIARKKQRVEYIIAELRAEIKAVRLARRRRTVRVTLLTLGVAMLLFTQGWRLMNFWWLIFPMGGFWNIDRSRQREFIQKLREAWDPRAVGVLAILAQDRDSELNYYAQQALLNLLPRVRASDAAYIDAEGMAALIELLRVDYDALRLALLPALEQIGDERAIPMVMGVRDSPRVRLEVRQAAAECLPALENRVRLARESATLLRASSGVGPSEAAAQLLRPTTGAPAATDHLLRPAATGSGTPPEPLKTTDPTLFSAKTPSEAVSDDTALRSGTSLS